MTEEKLLVERRFRTGRGSEPEQTEGSLNWEDLAAEHVVVVLGDPGAGKTTEFERQAGRTLGAVYLSVRAFLRLPLNEPRLHSETVFLDALDEMRASDKDQHEVLDKVISRLFELDRPKVRLSCRAADWFGNLDQSQLFEVSPSGKLIVVDLEPLTEAEVEQIVWDRIPDPAAFLETVHHQGLEGWLGNPQTLELMLKVAGKGRLPETRADLFEKACLIMAQEENAAHRQARKDVPPVDEILATAGFLCALTLISGVGGFAADRDEEEDEFPSLDGLPYPPDKLRVAISTRLFRLQDGRATPVHRTIAEFLGARAIRARVLQGLPLNRVLRLITGHDGGTLSELRGLYAWLATLTTEHSVVLVSRDPAALIFYGDPESLPIDARRKLLTDLESLSRSYPRFFYEKRVTTSFAPLADPALVPDLLAALEDAGRPRYFRLAILSALAYGRPLRALRDTVSAIVYGISQPRGIRELAVKALFSMSESSERHALLNDVHAGSIPDEDDRSLGFLLNSLYPNSLSTEDVTHYINPPKSPGLLGSYYKFLAYSLPTGTADNKLPDLLDHLALDTSWRTTQAWSDLVGNILQRALDDIGESVPPGRLWSWLKLAIDESGISILTESQQAAIRSWFNNAPKRITSLYQWWIENGSSSNDFHDDYSFWATLCRPNRPEDLWEWELSRASSLTGERRGDDLFRSVVYSMYNGAAHPTLDELHNWLARNPRFRQVMEPLNTYTIARWRTELSQETDRQEEEEDSTRAENLKYIRKNLEHVRSGRHNNILGHLGDLFLSYSPHTRGPSGLAKIEEEFGTEISHAAEQGFIRALHRKDLPSPEEIGESASKKKRYLICPALLAGAIILQRQGNLPHLDDSPSIRSALAFELTTPSSDHWFEEVLQKDPKGSAHVIRSTWGPLLSRNVEIASLYRIDLHPGKTLVAREIGSDLLISYPRAKAPILEQLMRMTLAGSKQEDLDQLIHKRALRGLTQDQRNLWLAFSLVVNPENSLKRVKRCLSRVDLHRLRSYIEDFAAIEGHSLLRRSAQVLSRLIRLFGEYCPPQPLPTNEFGRHHPFETYEFISRLISELGSRLDDEALSQLRTLRDDQALIAWRERLSDVFEQQRRKTREARFKRPSVSDTLQVIQVGPPSNRADLHAIACDHLRTLAVEVESGSTSDFRQFWNVDGPGDKLLRPVPENEARNRLASMLKLRLQPLGVSVQTEGTYSDDNRADIKIVFRSINIPIEIKRHYHREVWTAPQRQLKDKYSIDPDARGFGVYLVFWYGEAQRRMLPKLPTGISRPTNAAEMENALRQIYSGEEWRDTEFICIDLSPRKSPKGS